MREKTRYPKQSLRKVPKLLTQTLGKNDKVAWMFNTDETGRSESQDALTRLVSQVYVKLIKLDEEGLQPDSLSKEKIKNFLPS